MPSVIHKLGWRAELNLCFKNSGDKTILASRSQSGPLTVQRPFYPEANVCHLYLLHPPGGVVGGDELLINVLVKEQANVLITTPGATKFYRNTGLLAQQIQTLSVQDQCALEWFPQENIFFDGTHSLLKTRVELTESARFMGWEINCYGRPAANERFESGKVLTSLEIFRCGQPLLMDQLLIDTSKALQSPSSMNNYPCLGTFVATHVTNDLLETARLALAEIEMPVQIGLTLIDDILIARCLGNYAEQISIALKYIWSAIRPEVLGRDVCHPRIWST
jgi:urease accessory protein